MSTAREPSAAQSSNEPGRFSGAQLAKATAIYGVGSILSRAVGFLLLPVYTRYLTPADYGIVGAAMAIATALAILFPLELHGAVTRFYFKSRDERERRETAGAIWVTMVGIAAGLAILLEIIGPWLFGLLFRDIPYSPYIRFAIWIAFATSLGLVPLSLLRVKERPVLYVTLSASGTLLSLGGILYMVVVLRMGAAGYLAGMLAGTGAIAVPYVVTAIRATRPNLQLNTARAALAFSLPLVPHAAAAWVLEISDRVLLERFVSHAELGLYSLGYQVAGVVTLACAAFNSAWTPFLFRSLADDEVEAGPRLARMVTYYVAVLCFLTLGLVLLITYFFQVLTPPAFHATDQVTPVIAVGLALGGLYLIPVGPLYWRQKTKIIPVATIIAAGANVALNILLIPRFGMMAAAWTTVASYLLMLGLIWFAAERVYPLPYEYPRLGLLLMVTLSLYGVGTTIIPLEPGALDAALRALVWLAFPVVLWALRFFTKEEVEVLRSVVRRTRRRAD